MVERGGFELPVPLISTAFELTEKKKRPNTLEPGLVILGRDVTSLS
jgi:hypothetical protein